MTIASFWPALHPFGLFAAVGGTCRGEGGLGSGGGGRKEGSEVASLSLAVVPDYNVINHVNKHNTTTITSSGCQITISRDAALIGTVKILCQTRGYKNETFVPQDS
jgi:hypothetical protein